jgi:hypothetical protein
VWISLCGNPVVGDAPLTSPLLATSLEALDLRDFAEQEAYLVAIQPRDLGDAVDVANQVSLAVSPHSPPCDEPRMVGGDHVRLEKATVCTVRHGGPTSTPQWISGKPGRSLSRSHGVVSCSASLKSATDTSRKSHANGPIRSRLADTRYEVVDLNNLFAGEPQMATQQEIRDQITAQIVDALSKGTVPWRKPWRSDKNAEHPANAVSRKAYTGVNPLLLQMAADQHGFTSRFWATYRQWQQLGGQVMARPSNVKPGEWGTQTVFCKPCKKTTEDEDGEETERTFFVLRTYVVFNVEQVVGSNRACLPRATP